MTLLQSIIQFVAIYGFFWWLFVIVERIKPAHKQALISRQSAIELGHGIINYFLVSQVTAIVSALIILYMLAPYAPYQLLSSLGDYPFWLQFIAMVFLLDTTQYVRHRFTHRFIWSCHAIHHSASELRSTTHFRQHPIDYVVSAIFETTFLYVLGFEGHAVIWAILFMQINNMWLHVNVDIDYGFPLRHLLASPNYHKWHHARVKEAVDKNFADLFPILDFLGGTYYYPRHTLPKEYGVLGVARDDGLYTSIWGALFYPLRQARSLVDKKRI